jgi:tetratricopeptide (TPR) repeat protein
VAQDISSSLKKPSLRDLHKMIALMAMKRISGASYGSVVSVAKKMVSLEIEKSISRDIPSNAYLELALTSFQKKQYSMTEYYLEKLEKFKKPKLKAASLTIRGMIEQSDGRLPEAVDYWNRALKVVSTYIPARLNLGFYALKYGDFQTAKKYLSGMNDYFALTGYMQAVRQASPSNAQSLCRRILGKKRGYKPALFSCALNTAQGKGDLKKAKSDLQKIAKTRGGPSEIDEKAYLVIAKIERKLRKQEMEKRAQAKPKKSAAPEQTPATPATK